MRILYSYRPFQLVYELKWFFLFSSIRSHYFTKSTVLHPANGIMAKREILARGLKALIAERMLYHMPTYNKLVRDKILDIITSSGKESPTHSGPGGV